MTLLNFGVVLVHELAKPFIPLRERVKIFRWMHLAGLNFSHLLAECFRRIAPLIPAAIARLGFRDVPETAADAVHRPFARPDGMDELDAKLPQALADFCKSNRLGFALQQRGAFPQAA